ncbi:MAG TPA: ATP-binding protein, partial [Thermoanaerobaculia bacterium]|nr:ATP-binding protein [Thermoanaerobaculia bacterium]
ADAPELAPTFAAVAASVNEVKVAGDQVFSFFAAGDMAAAGAQMARADAAYRRFRESTAAITAALNAKQDRAFAADAAAAAHMRELQTITALLIVGIMVGMAFYGRAVARRLMGARERELLLEEQRRTEAALSASEERFRLAACATNDVIWDWNLASNSVWFNETFQTRLGYPASGDLDLSAWLDNVHPDDAPRVMDSIHQTLEHGGHSWSSEYRFRLADGSYGDFLDRAYVVSDANGAPVRIIGAMLDLTERKRAELALRELNQQLSQLSLRQELILNSAADGIFGMDLNGRPTFLNPAAAQMIGTTLAEMEGRTIHEIVHHSHADGTPFPAELCPKLIAMRTGQATAVTEDIFWRKDGTSFAVEYTATPKRSPEGKTVGAVVTFRDITERRAVQRLKDEFVSLVSHELRTPLTSIRGALGLLAGGLLQRSPEKGQRMLDIAVGNTDRLVRLINDILDLERIDSGKVTLSKVRCKPLQLLQDSAELMRPMADKAGVQIEIGTAAAGPVWADADRITQTITNLLSNAIKFSEPGTTISLSADHGRDGILFRVADQGRGIPADKLEAVFERFQQVDASDSREKGGSGLGLTICRSIVREHGGDIDVQSSVGMGSVFSFSLPAAAESAGERVNAGGARVIVCDDDAAVRETLQAMLEQRGYDVAQADGGEELVKVARVFAPDVI